MPGKPVRLGPFQGGLNTLSDPTAVADSEVVDCVNFELDLDGSLSSRPPITPLSTAARGMKRLLGYFIQPDGGYYLVGVSTNRDLSYFDGTDWYIIAVGFDATAMVQYQGKAWFIKATDGGGSWTPAAGWTAVAAIPGGYSILAHKNRLFVAPGKKTTTNGARLKFSSVTDPAVWNSADFLDIGPGDGQNITDIAVMNNNIVIFKTDSTHVYAYESGPERGSVSRVSATTGASDKNCIVAYENVMFVYHEGNVYEMINYNYQRINPKVPFTVDNKVAQTFRDPVSMSLFSDRLIVRHFDRVYVFNIRTRTWSRWESTHPFSYFVVEPKNSLITDIPTAYAVAAVDGTVNELYRIKDAFTTTDSETMECYVRTKNYDYGISSNYKKLFWWGADVLAQDEVKVSANAIVYSFSVTWDQLNGRSWDSLHLLNTWDQPLEVMPVVADQVDARGAGSRKFIRFLKTQRFRQIFFDIRIVTNGTASKGPVKIFNLTTYVDNKETVSKKIS